MIQNSFNYFESYFYCTSMSSKQLVRNRTLGGGSMPEYLVMIEIRRVYEMCVTAPDDTAIFEYQEKPLRLSEVELDKLKSAELYGKLISRSDEVIEIIEGV